MNLKSDWVKQQFQELLDHRYREAMRGAQPAIVTAEIAMLAALRSELGLRACVYGGHSLGESTARAAAGVIDVAAAVTLVRERGRFMQEAVPVGEGAMATSFVHGYLATV